MHFTNFFNINKRNVCHPSLIIVTWGLPILLFANLQYVLFIVSGGEGCTRSSWFQFLCEGLFIVLDVHWLSLFYTSFCNTIGDRIYIIVSRFVCLHFYNHIVDTHTSYTRVQDIGVMVFFLSDFTLYADTVASL